MLPRFARVAITHGGQPFRSRAIPSNKVFLAVGAVGIGSFALTQARAECAVDYSKVRKDIAGLLDQEGYDDGSLGPIFIRLAWHAAGTYDNATKTGGSNGATMRFAPESNHGANAGLHIARDILEKVKKNHPGISYADLWTLAGVVAVEEMGGPEVKWTPGRTDASSGSACPPDGRLPDASQGADHLRWVFNKMDMNDQEIVALSGAHTFGRCHTDRSGFWGPWTRAPTTFSNMYFKELTENKWTPKKWKGPAQFEDPTGELMMLPTDLCLTTDPVFKKHVAVYAKDEAKFAADFSAAFSKLLHLGCAPAAKPCCSQTSGSSYTPAVLIAGLAALGLAK